MTALPTRSTAQVRGGGPGEDTSSPGVPAKWIVRATVAQMGHRCLAVKRECPVPRRSTAPRRCPFVLDSLHGTPAASRVRLIGRIMTRPTETGAKEAPRLQSRRWARR